MLHSPNSRYNIQLLQQEQDTLQVNPKKKCIAIILHIYQ